MSGDTEAEGSKRVVRFGDARHFYELVRPALERREIENSLLLGTAKRLADENGKAFMLALRSETGIEAAALHWAPYEVSISAADRSAIERLADAVWETGEALSGAIGLKEQARWFAERWASYTSKAWRKQLDMLFYTLTTVVPPAATAAGALRLATPTDQDWVADWSVAFAVEAKLPEFERQREHVARMVQSRIVRGEQFVWEDQGRAVTILLFTPTGINGARIGGVMTAPDQRRKGYGSTAVAALSQKLLDEGKSWCGLFADAENPESNRVYQRLGYREACRFQSIAFV